MRRNVEQLREARRHRGKALQVVYRGKEPSTQLGTGRGRRESEGQRRAGGLQLGAATRAGVTGREVGLELGTLGGCDAPQDELLQELLDVDGVHDPSWATTEKRPKGGYGAPGQTVPAACPVDAQLEPSARRETSERSDGALR